MRWDAECAEVAVRIEEDTLQEHLECLLGHPIRTPIRFSLGMSLLGGVGSSWRAAVDLLIAETKRADGLLQSPLVAAQLEALILTGLLTAQPHNYTAALRTEPKTPPPRAIRNALEYIHTEYNRAMTTERVAAQAGMSTRALHRGFREHVGCTPMDYLRDIRLKRAREMLAAADASSALTVTEVALDAGFMHMGRFSAQYRRRFGESPSETLRR
jgi:AraC-like DNA-binding protein